MSFGDAAFAGVHLGRHLHARIDSAHERFGAGRSEHLDRDATMTIAVTHLDECLALVDTDSRGRHGGESGGVL